MSGEDTIFAVSSGAGAAGVAVIRVSGPGAAAAIAALSRRPPGPARRAALAAVYDPASGELLDRGLVLWFPGPASVTGEDVAEFHVHGGRAVVAGVLGALGGCDGLRPAEPGEFTRRAFEHGKMDLTAAEGIADLVAAETAAQRRQAVAQSEGGLARLYDDWRERLIRVLAYMEADIDFPEDGLPEELAAGVAGEIDRVGAAIGAHLADGGRGERLREGLAIAIVGAPNVGKSSLLNRLARREAAIVSATAGTTRDVVEVHLDLGGYPVIIADTAGLREISASGAGGEIEREGMRRARARAAAADLRLAVFEAGGEVDGATLALVDDRTVVVVNKCDRRGVTVPERLGGRSVMAMSALTGAGVDGLMARLGEEARRRWGAAESPALTRLRHRKALEEAVQALQRGRAAGATELRAEDVRLAVRAIGRVTGRVDVEDVLDVIFREFCIGK